MTARARVAAIVAVAACVAAGAVVGVTFLQTRGESTTAPGSVTKPRAGIPPLFLDFGVRDGRDVRDLSRAANLLQQKRVAAARAIFSRYNSLPAQIGTAFANWPNGGLDTLKRLAGQNPQSALAAFNLGFAYLWSGRVSDAAAAWQRVAAKFPDSPESVQAENLLYPRYAKDLPFLVLPVALPRAPSRAVQLRRLAAAAQRPDEAAKLRYGLALWQLWRRVSAERQFAAAAKLAPRDPAARTAAAVALFTKRAPVRAFSKLGPLTGVFPRSAAVRFHLGVLLVWTGDAKKGLVQLRLAAADEPDSLYGREARKLLDALVTHGTK
jgi:tetratricopeptide (TPR) repeat protein